MFGTATVSHGATCSAPVVPNASPGGAVGPACLATTLTVAGVTEVLGYELNDEHAEESKGTVLGTENAVRPPG